MLFTGLVLDSKGLTVGRLQVLHKVNEPERPKVSYSIRCVDRGFWALVDSISTSKQVPKDRKSHYFSG
jgi:hypothetical protein